MANAAYKHLYNTRRWYRLRHHQLAQQPFCVDCARRDRSTAAKIVDHIRPHRGDEALFFDDQNLQSLCKPCHDGAKQQFEKSGTVRGCGVDGVPVDVNHHWNVKD